MVKSSMVVYRIISYREQLTACDFFIFPFSEVVYIKAFTTIFLNRKIDLNCVVIPFDSF